MRALTLPALLLLTPILSGCLTVQNHADEAAVAATVQAVRTNVAVAPDRAAQATVIVCGYAPLVVNEINTVSAALGTPGPKTRKALNAANVALATVNAYCAGGGQSGSRIGQLLGVWRAYQAAKIAAAEAKKAGGA